MQEVLQQSHGLKLPQLPFDPMSLNIMILMIALQFVPLSQTFLIK